LYSSEQTLKLATGSKRERLLDAAYLRRLRSSASQVAQSEETTDSGLLNGSSSQRC